MSDEKIDLSRIESNCRRDSEVMLMFPDEVLALVAAVRAARNLEGKDHGRAWTDLQEALAPFTDSAEKEA